jgi:hypothetical protein
MWLHNAEVRTQGYEAICNDIDEVLMSLSPFAAAWASAPESMKRYCERDVAEYFYGLGYAKGQITSATSNDLAEMNRLMREKGLA